jgi:hypothetical protein
LDGVTFYDYNVDSDPWELEYAIVISKGAFDTDIEYGRGQRERKLRVMRRNSSRPMEYNEIFERMVMDLRHCVMEVLWMR